jgi:hypothetical protein
MSYTKNHCPHNKIRYINGQMINEILFLRELPVRILPKGGENRFGVFVCNFCGNEFECRITYIRSGHTKSCGCRQGKFTHNLYKHPIYSIWSGLLGRCYNPKNTGYHNYGGRGIGVCDEWRHDFIPFYEWAINNGYSIELSIDRIKVNEGYSPSNCRFTTKEVQARNRRQSRDMPSGIDWMPRLSKYRCRIKVKRKEIHIGLFSTIELALQARKNFVLNNNLLGFYDGESI